MKRQFMKGLMSLCAGVMTLCAASSLFVSCYDDSALQEQITELDGRVQNLESLKTKLEELTARVDALYTLKFQVTTNNELQYSFDGGKTWESTGIILAAECDCEPCPPCQYVPCDHECPEVSLVDNGDSVTIKVGDAEFTIEKPEEIVFELRAGKLYFESEGTVTVNIKSSGIEDITVMSAPKGWWAEINSDGKVEITAPDYESTQGTLDYETWEEIPGENAPSGYVKVHACSVEGKCMVGKVAVEVTNSPLSVKAFDGNAYFTVAGTSSWPPTFFYGACLKEELVAATQDLIKRVNDGDWYVTDDYLNNWGEETEITTTIAELLGEEPEKGQEYVVWALIQSYDGDVTVDDLVCAYYSPLDVKITEVEAERTAYNVTVNVEVSGADSYVAVAMPGSYIDEYSPIEGYAEQMAMAINEGQYYGKLYTESYSGSALDIAAGTTYSMTGNYAPAMDVYVLILPLDGRANEDYTVENVVIGKFATADLTAGGSINLTAKQVTEYMGEVYDYDIWDYVEALIKLDPYTELGVEVTPSSTANWSAFYYSFLTPEDYATLSVSDEALVGYLLEGWGMTPSEVEKWPLYVTEKVSPATTVHFVAFIVDETGKYGELAKVELTSQELKKAEYTWVEPLTSNVVDGVLKNTTTLEITPKFEEGTEPASYKYVLAQTQYYNQWEGYDDAQMAEQLYFSESTSVKTISADELVNGVLYVTGHSYGYPYYFAIVPIDAEGNPGPSAAILEYDVTMEVLGVKTEGAEFEATKPELTLRLPKNGELYPDNEWGDDAYYGYAYSSYDQKYQYYYEIGYNVTPVAGTEVCTVLVDLESYTLGADADTKAGQAWSGALGSWKTNITSEKFESSLSYYSHYEDQDAPNLILVVSWQDADGNYYYEEYPLQEKMQAYADRMTTLIYHSPYKKQYSFDWVEYAQQMGLESMPACIDLGVSAMNYFMAGIDYEAIYGEEAAGMWMAGMEGVFEIEPTDNTSGVISIMRQDFVTGEMVPGAQMTYSNYTETSCTFNCADLILNNIEGTLMTETVTVMPQGIAM